MSTYATHALKQQAAIVASSKKGTRQQTLSGCARLIAPLVHSGLLTREETVSAFMVASLEAGLSPTEALSTIESSLSNSFLSRISGGGKRPANWTEELAQAVEAKIVFTHEDGTKTKRWIKRREGRLS